jgi:hypothetical protein
MYVFLFLRGVNVPFIIYIRELQFHVSFVPEKCILAEVKAPPLVYDVASLFDDSPYSLQREVAG